MERIFFDESGQTGTNMFDPEQPYFVLGSTNIPEPEAAEIIADVSRAAGSGAEVRKSTEAADRASAVP